VVYVNCLGLKHSLTLEGQFDPKQVDAPHFWWSNSGMIKITIIFIMFDIVARPILVLAINQPMGTFIYHVKFFWLWQQMNKELDIASYLQIDRGYNF
jgi:hypothetical protein